MTDTGRVPNEGQPEDAGMAEQPGIPAAGEYAYLGPSEAPSEDDDLLLMPSAQGGWSDPQPVPPPESSPVSPPVQGAGQQEHGGHAARGRYGVPQVQQVTHGQRAEQVAPAPPIEQPAPMTEPASQIPVQVAAGQAQHASQGAYGMYEAQGTPAQPAAGASDGQGYALAQVFPIEQGLPDQGVSAAQIAAATPAAPAAAEAVAPSQVTQERMTQDQTAAEQSAQQQRAQGQAEPHGTGRHEQAAQGVETADAAAAYEAATHETAAHEAGAHEAGGRNSGSVDLSAVRVPSPAGPPEASIGGPAAQTPAASAPARRPLHLGPPVPDATSSVVRSLADRGPAARTAPAYPVRSQTPGPPTTGPEYLDVPRDEPAAAQGQGTVQGAGDTPQGGVPWVPQSAQVPAAPEELPAGRPEAESPLEPQAVPTRAQEPAPESSAPESVPEQARRSAHEPAVGAPEPEPGPAQDMRPQHAPGPAVEVVTEAAEVIETPQAPEVVEAAPAVEAVPAAEAIPAVDAAPADEAASAAQRVEPVENTDSPDAGGAGGDQAEGGDPVEQAAHDEPAGSHEPAGSDEPVQHGRQPGTPEQAGPPEQQAAAPERTDPAGTLAAPSGYDDAERAAVLRVMRERRDIRNGFRSDPVPHDVLLRVLEAAHTAPSVGHSQPWDFVVIRSEETRRAMHELAQRQRDAYAKSLPKGRAKQFKELKIEAILDTPVNIVVTADPTRGGRHTLGRHTQPQMAPYSSALAVENLWLAARAEGLGVGWVSFFDEREMVRALGLPEHLEVVAYLCVGYVDAFPEDPELMQAGWSKRRPLAWVVHEETYGRRVLPGAEQHNLLEETVAAIRPLDAKALGEAWERQKRMTKPPGALGVLEIISAQLSGLSRMSPPPIPEPAAVAIFAGDHGVHAQGVTPWPQEVTGQMVANFLGGGAVCNAFATQVGAEVCVIDVGVASELPATAGLLPRKVRAGTADFTTGPAMSREEAVAAIEVGIETARDLVTAGNKALLTGEMGIANTTVAAALISVFTGTEPSEVTGRGTGINDETHARKVDVVRRALELHRPDPADPIGVLAAVGGLEHAALVGFLLGGASMRTPVILDGVSAGAAALVARAIAPEALAACIAGHRSAEPGHMAALTKLGLRPLVDLDLRLGEGTGALLALPLVQSAARAMHEVATFDSAGVTEK